LQHRREAVRVVARGAEEEPLRLWRDEREALAGGDEGIGQRTGRLVPAGPTVQVIQVGAGEVA
jgi:hypothetical protein